MASPPESMKKKTPADTTPGCWNRYIAPLLAGFDIEIKWLPGRSGGHLVLPVRPSKTLSGPAPFVVVAALIMLTAVCLAGAENQAESKVLEKAQKGDFWGGYLGVGAAAAGTLLFFGALLTQAKELKLQKKELEDSREVAKQQATALRAQTQELARQNAMQQDRNDVDWLMSVLAQFPSGPSPMIRLVVERIVDIAEGEVDRTPEPAVTSPDHTKSLAMLSLAVARHPQHGPTWMWELRQLLDVRGDWYADTDDRKSHEMGEWRFLAEGIIDPTGQEGEVMD